MGSFAVLPVERDDGSPLPHTFYQGDGAGLLVNLPGLHYGPDGPVLYWLGKELQRSGWDTLGLTYGFQAGRKTSWTEHLPDTLEETARALVTARRHRDYPIVAVAGKSLGSLLLAQLCANGSVPEPTRIAHLTPPLGNPFFDDAFAATAHPAYLAIGTADNFYDEGALTALLARRPAWVRVVKDADHGLDVPGDLSASLDAVGLVVRDAVAFLRDGVIPGLDPPAV